MRLIGMVASPTFVIINGVMVGFLHQTRGNGFDRFRAMLVDRGLFLLTIGHLVILGSHLSYTYRFLSITDTVGVAVLIGPWLVTKLRQRDRLLLSFAAYFLSWAIIQGWHPQSPVLDVVKETIFGSLNPSIYYYAFPLLPWLSLDVAASVLGDCLGSLWIGDDIVGMQDLLVGTGGVGLAAAAAINGLAHLLRVEGSRYAAMAHAFASPFQKEPPSLVYLLTYGALGLGLIAICLRLAQHKQATGLIGKAATLGRNSFAVFVIQFYVYFTILPLIHKHLPFEAAWWVYFPASVLMISLPTLVWHRCGYNKFLTVGYRRGWMRAPITPGRPLGGFEVEELSRTA